jgi:putative ABC transport system permease protein
VSSQPAKSVINRPRRTGRRRVRGRALLLWRFAASDLRHHVTQAVLLLAAIAAAATVLTMALALNGVTNNPYQQTQAATKGPDVVAYGVSAGQARTLIHAPGVTKSSGPYAIASAIISYQGRTAGVEAEARTASPAAVDQPKLIAGTWVRSDGIVLERSFAEALGAGVGDRVTLDGHPYTVVGTAVTAAAPPYPDNCYHGGGNCPFDLQSQLSLNPGIGWITEPAARSLASAAAPLSYVLNLKLSNPANALAFVCTYSGNTPGNCPSGSASHPLGGSGMATWQGIAAADGLLVRDAQGVLESGTLLLGLLALASVAVLVGSRLAEHTQRVGLLKAVGATPDLVAAAFLAENLFLALVAAFAGLAAGWLAAPLLASPGAGLIGAPGAPSLTLVTVVVVLIVALAVALASTLVPAIRAARTSTVNALADAPRLPKRRDLMIRVSSRLPVPTLLGLRLVARRPRRALLSAASIAVTVMGIVAVLAFHADASSKFSFFGSSGGLGNPVISRDEQVLTVITILLITLAALTTIFTAWATVLDARRASALTLALGATRQQVRAGLATAQVMSALPGAILGFPLGIGLFKVAAKGLSGLPPALWLVAAMLGTLLVVVALTSVPARIGTRRPVAEVLQAEEA